MLVDLGQFKEFLTKEQATLFVAVSNGYNICFGKGFVMDYVDCKCSLVLSSFNRKLGPDFSRPSGNDLITLASFRQSQMPLHFLEVKAGSGLTHVDFLQFLSSGQYGLCFGYCFLGPLPLRSHKGQVRAIPFKRVWGG